MSGEDGTRRTCGSTAQQRIRILCLRDTESLCGPGKTIVNTCRTIDGNRFVLAVAVPVNGCTDNVLLEHAREAGAATFPIHMANAFDILAVFRLVRLLRRHHIHILQTHDPQTRRLGAISALLAGAVHVSSTHGWITNTRWQTLTSLLDKWLIRSAQRVIVVSEPLRDQLVSFGVAPSRIALLRNGILLDDYPAGYVSDRLKTEFGLHGCKVVGIVGRLSPEKAHHVFLEMARRLRTRRSDVKFLIVGDGPMMADLRTRARELGLDGTVVFTGHRADMLDVYAAIDVLVLCSITEGLPNAVLEAFACGKPVVATRVGGVPDLVSAETGFLVEPGDAEGLAARVTSLLEDDRLAAALGANARRLVEEKFNFHERTRGLEALYEGCVQ